MRKMMVIILLGIPFLGACQNSKEPVTAANVDLNRYLGKWYEIARFPHKFEKDLVGVTAQYKILDNGRIEVINSGFKGTLDGDFQQVAGKAKVPDKNDPSKLKVSFFLFFYADYYILELDTVNYQYSLVGSSSDKYLWILSRTPVMTDENYNMLVEKARERGYVVENLIKVEQKMITEYDKKKTISNNN